MLFRKEKPGSLKNSLTSCKFPGDAYTETASH